MSDDFERAILISFNFQGGIDPQYKERANAFIAEVKKNPDCWRLCTERFSTTSYTEVKFWCLQTLHELVRSSYAAFTPETKAAIKGAILTWLQRDCSSLQNTLPPYLRNKLAQTLVAVLQYEYPSSWPTFFQDLIGAMALGEGVVDMFCRILVSVDEDLVSLDIPRSQDESKLSMHVKDSMREHSIADVASAWYNLVSSYKDRNPDLAAFVLQTMQRYISWIDIGLVANDKFTPLLESLLEQQPPHAGLRGGALDCLTEVLSKRMEAVPKLQLVQQIKIVPLVARWGGGFPVSEDSGEDELLVKYARLLATLASEVMDSLKRVENGVISLTAMGFAVDEDAAREVGSASALANTLMEQLFPAALSAFKSQVDEVSLPLLPFLVAYVGRLKTLQKRNSGLSPDALLHVRAILEGLAICARYPLNTVVYAGAAPSPAELSAAQEEQAEVEEKRRDLFTLFKNISKITFNEALAFVGGLLQQLTMRSDATFQEAEISVMLLYELGEGAPEEALKPDSGALGQLALALMQATIPCAHHRLVALAVLETYVRYARVLQQQQHVIPAVVMTFMDARGMGHPSEDVSTRACYLFNRLVKTLRQNLRPYIPTILTSLQPHLTRVATTPLTDPAASPGGPAGAVAVAAAGAAAKSGAGGAVAPNQSVVDDRLYVFEAVGQLLGDDQLPLEQQQSYLNALLQPLLQEISGSLAGAASSSLAPGLILQAMEAIGRLNKGFRTDLCTRTRPQIGAMFIQCLEVALQVPRAYPVHKLLRSRFISLVHRLVECLTASLLPYLPAALEVLVNTQADALDLVEVLQLLNQLLMRFKEALVPLLTELLPVLVLRIHALLNGEWDWSGRMAAPGAMPAAAAAAAGGAQVVVAATLEDAREKGELQRAYYSLLHVVAHQGCSAALLAAPAQVLDGVMRGLLQGAATHVDVTVRRTCVQVFQRLLADWCAGGSELVPGLKRFAMERLGGDACISGLLRGGPGPAAGPLDPRDATVLALLGDVSSTLKLIYSACGDEFPAHLLASVLPALGLPQALQQQLVYHLREGQDAKELKEGLRALLTAAVAAAAGQQGVAAAAGQAKP